MQEFANYLSSKVVEEGMGSSLRIVTLHSSVDIIGELITKIQRDYILILYVHTKVSDFFDKKSRLIDSK